MQKKIILLVVIILAVIGVWLYLFFTSPVKEEPKETTPKGAELPEIKIVDSTLISFIATEKGFFKEEGLQVKLERMLPEDSMSALLAGEGDYAIFLEAFAPPHIKASLRNAPIKTIMFIVRSTRVSLVAQPKLELNDLKTIAIFSRHSSAHYQLLKFIKENNLEVEIIAPKPQEVVWTIKELEDLLLRGEVDAILTLSRSSLRLQVQGFPILDILVDTLPSSLSIRNDKIVLNPEEVQKVVRALERTIDFIVTRPEETKELILKAWGLEKTEENLATVKEYYPLIKTGLDRRNVPANEGAELLIQIAKAGMFATLQEVEEQIVTPEDLQKVFDFRFVK